MKNLLNRSEAAKLLNISERTLDELRKSEGLPSLCLGGRVVRFDEDELKQWLDTRRKPQQPKAEC